MTANRRRTVDQRRITLERTDIRRRCKRLVPLQFRYPLQFFSSCSALRAFCEPTTDARLLLVNIRSRRASFLARMRFMSTPLGPSPFSRTTCAQRY